LGACPEAGEKTLSCRSAGCKRLFVGQASCLPLVSRQAGCLPHEDTQPREVIMTCGSLLHRRRALMAGHSSFRNLIRRLRDGDPDAAAEIVRQYEPEIRRILRVRLSTSRLRKELDSADICQSVMANFFFRAALGQFELESPERLLRLLVTMARN